MAADNNNERPLIRTIPQSPEQQAEVQEYRIRQEIRQNYLVPISVMWGTDVPPPEAEAALQGVKDALSASGQNRQLINYGSKPFSTGDYSSADWYIAKAYKNQELERDAGFGPQLVAEELTRIFVEEPWQGEPHWEVMIVNQDLNARSENGYLNFVFGSTNKDFAASIQSVNRIIRGVRDEPLRLSMIRRLLRHEVGHMFGLPSRDIRVEQNLGLHCTNICSMRQGLSTEAWATQVREEDEAGIHFCSDCKEDLERNKTHYKPLSDLEPQNSET